MEETNLGILPESKEGKLNVSKINLKKINWLKVGIAAAVIIIVLVGILWWTFSMKSVSAGALKTGDSANFEYTLSVDGKVVDSNTSKMTVGQIGKGFGFASNKADSAVVGLNKSDSAVISLSSSEAFGNYNPARIVIMNRTQTMKRADEIDRIMEIPSSVFKQSFSEDPVLNKIYSPSGAPWEYKVVGINGSNVMLSQETEEGKMIPVNSMIFATVTKITADKIFTELNINGNQTLEIATGNLSVYADNDYIYFKLTPPVGEVIPLGNSLGKVLSFNETSIVVDYNNPYAGKNVTLALKVLDISSSKKIVLGSDAGDIRGAPTLEVFVVSYCPYGLQMEKGLLSAYDLLKGKANFKVRFFSAMHGQQEVDENNRQLCIREETKQFWQYLSCFLDKGTASACLKTAGIDESKITECMGSRAKDYMDIDNQLNEQYGGITGSPTSILNGAKVEIYPRSPEDVKNAVCNAFSSKPSECSTKLDTANPSPGFGLGTSSTAQAASCGSA